MKSFLSDISDSDKDLLNPFMKEIDISEISKEITKLIYDNIDPDTILIVPYWLAYVLLIGKPFIAISVNPIQKVTTIVPLGNQYNHRVEKDEYNNDIYKRDVYIRKYITIKI